LNNLENLYRRGMDLLQKIPNNHIDTRLILLDCFGLSNEDFIKNPELEPSRKDIKRYFHMIGKRRKGYPLSYLIGIKEFWSIPFLVKKGVFIPRPETELIIETVVALNLVENPNIADIGTGSGNIAVSLAKEFPGAKIFATDISKKALRTAQKNARMQGIEEIQFFHGDFFEPLKRKGPNEKFDFILSNPPYVSQEEWETLPDEIKLYEPKRSLVSGDSGLNIFKKMISSAFKFLKPGGYLVFEIGYGQKEKILNLFNGQWKEIKCYDDLSEIPRVVSAEMG
jgi:release factor glutamine methyltransferase